jgi:hypothetical protein
MQHLKMCHKIVKGFRSSLKIVYEMRRLVQNFLKSCCGSKRKALLASQIIIGFISFLTARD